MTYTPYAFNGRIIRVISEALEKKFRKIKAKL